MDRDRDLHPLDHLRDTIKNLDLFERKLILAIFLMALIALGIGGAAAFMLVIHLTGIIDLDSSTRYVLLTLHGSSAFNYWLYFAQAGLMLLLLLVYGRVRLSNYIKIPILAGSILMTVSYIMVLVSIASGSEVTYSILYPLAHKYGSSILMLIGYSTLYMGLIIIAVSMIQASISARARSGGEWSSVAFASFLWMVLLAITSFASFLVYFPELQLILGRDPIIKPYSFEMSWSVMFHNLHYLPIMSTVILWYVLSELTTGVKSIFSERISKAIFSIYFFVIPPTSVYHLFLEPGLPESIKLVGSILSLGVSVPTIAVAFLILSSLEISARSNGYPVLTWIKALPWKNPFFMALAISMITAFAGGSMANVVIQHRFAQLLSDTFAVPGYFHFFTLGSVSIVFISSIMLFSSFLNGSHRIALRSLSLASPIFIAAGLYIFGVAGIIAGYSGLPRRTLEFSYGLDIDIGGYWSQIAIIIGVGGIIMASAAFLYLISALLTVLGVYGSDIHGVEVRDLRPDKIARGIPVTPAIVIALLLVAISIATLAATSIMNNLPIEVGGH